MVLFIVRACDRSDTIATMLYLFFACALSTDLIKIVEAKAAAVKRVLLNRLDHALCDDVRTLPIVSRQKEVSLPRFRYPNSYGRIRMGG